MTVSEQTRTAAVVRGGERSSSPATSPRLGAGPPDARAASRAAGRPGVPRAAGRRSRLGEALVRLFRRSLDWGFHAGRGASAIAAEAESPAWAESETRPVEEIGSPQPHASGLEADDACRARSERERRAFPRRESICLVSVYRQHDDGPVNQQEVRWLLHSSPLKGAIDDISMNGVAFLLHETIEPGTHLLMRLVNRRLDRHFDTSGRVVRAIPDGLGEWKIVCRFDRNLSLDQVHEYGQNVFASELV